ncbi:amidohydrolase family protein [Candidatus Woesearchaeota archaeon]|nr:amidohydrolase family protein [Candidatus Woesearchaeota archaeon]
MKKLIPIIAVSVILVLVVGYFVFNYTVKKITEREVKRITQEEIGRITNEEIDKATQSEIDRVTDEIVKQRTEEITRQILGGGADSGNLQEVECDKIPTQRQFASSPYYTGTLIDAHLHMPFTFEAPKSLYQQADWPAPILEKEVLAGDIICGFDKEKISSAFGFYVVPNLLKGQALKLIKQIEQQHTGRITPFLMPTHVSGLDLRPNEAEEILNSNKGLFKGYGEIAFYKGSFKGVSPDDPSMLEIYKIADKHNLIVMLHPDDGQKQAIEKILKENPNVKFLLHGENMWPWVENIIGTYPNAFYSIDANLFNIPNEHTIANIYGPEKEEFVSEFKANFDKILKVNLEIWKPRIEKHPDSYLWGTDRGYGWHFDSDVDALLEEMSRSFIGQLGHDVQEKFAYKNAERLLEER